MTYQPVHQCVEYLNQFLRRPNYADVAEKLHIADRLTAARNTLEAVASPGYPQQLAGTLGAEPIENYTGADRKGMMGLTPPHRTPEISPLS